MTRRATPHKPLGAIADEYIAANLTGYTSADTDALRNALTCSYRAGYMSASLSNHQIAVALGINVLEEANRVRVDFKAFADQQLGKETGPSR